MRFAHRMMMIAMLVPVAVAAAVSTTEPAATEPAGASAAVTEPDPRVEALLDALESSDGAAREAATRELVSLGPVVLAALEARLADAPPPELAGRAAAVKDGIAHAWRYWSADAGPICAGFQAMLLSPSEETTFRAGEPILLEVELRNVSPNRQTIIDVRGVDFDLGGGDHAVFTSPFSDGRIVIRRLSGDGKGDGAKAVAGVKGRAVVYDTGDARAVELKTGKCVTTPVRIDGGASLPPGEYDARFVYYARTKKLLDAATHDMRSNVFRFKVEPAAK